MYKILLFMKFFVITTTMLFVNSSLFAQKKNTNKSKVEPKGCYGGQITYQFRASDTIISCSTCHWDACGNIIDKNLDTLYKNKGLVSDEFKPLFITNDSILLTKRLVVELIEKNKIRHMHFLHCNEVLEKIGFTAIEGVYFIQLRDTVFSTNTLLEVVSKKYSDSCILNSQILVNDYYLRNSNTNLKYPSKEPIKIDEKYYKRTKQYCIITE